MTTALGREIAGLYSGRLGESLFPLPIVSPKPVAGHAIARHGPMLWLPWSNLRDRLEMGQR